MQTSRSKSLDLRRTTAESTLRALDGCGWRGLSLSRVDFVVSGQLVRRSRLYPVRVPRLASLLPRFFQTVPRGSALAVRSSFPPSRWTGDFHPFKSFDMSGTPDCLVRRFAAPERRGLDAVAASNAWKTCTAFLPIIGHFPVHPAAFQVPFSSGSVFPGPPHGADYGVSRAMLASLLKKNPETLARGDAHPKEPRALATGAAPAKLSRCLLA